MIFVKESNQDGNLQNKNFMKENVILLNEQELINISGGDKAMFDLGYCIGYIGKCITNIMTSQAELVQLNPVIYG